MLAMDKSMSLVQLKKQQWAREREEMSKCYIPWGTDNSHYQHACSGSSRMQIRNQFASNLELHKQSSYQYHEEQPIQRQRSPSLPPIRKPNEYCLLDSSRARNNENVLDRNIVSYEKRKFSNYDEDCEGDTSGYASDTFHHLAHGSSSTGSYHQNRGEPYPVIAAWQNKSAQNQRLDLPTEAMNRPSKGIDCGPWSPQSLGPGSADEARPRWGDKGVATGKLWEPQDPSARLPQMQIHKTGTPAWVERGLNMMESIPSEVLVIDQNSNHSGGMDCDRSSYAGSDGGKNTYLRGQNAPVGPEIKAQRENRRLKALEIQSVILSQLEERDRIKKEERARRIREEQEEEMRIKRQQEEDLQRLEDERRRSEEKRETERKKIETLRMAIEEAEMKAKQAKDNKKRTFRRIHDTAEQKTSHYVEIDETTPAKEETIKTNKSVKDLTTNGSSRHDSPRKSVLNTTFDITPRINSNEYRSIEQSSKNTSQSNTPRSSQTDNMKMFLPGPQRMNLYPDGQVNLVPIALTHDMLSSNSIAPHSMQFAVLLPQNNNLLYSLQQPIALNPNVLVHLDENMQSEKILTPRKYRNPKSRDACTQTDLNHYISKLNNSVQEKSTDTGEKSKHKVDKDYQNIDENAPLEVQNISNSNKKERRFRSEERYKKEIDNRPKWGVNRPAAQYKKQSEKDPFYSQKRKLRQRHRPATQRYLSQSSEDSRSPSPPTQSDKMSIKNLSYRQTLSQSHWRNKHDNDDTFKPSNATVETVNIQSLECNKTGQVFISDEINETQQRKMVRESPIKRITLSQKFINDKYGNRKLWQEDGTCDEGNYSMDNNTLVPLFSKDNRKIEIDRGDTNKRDMNDIVDIHNNNLVLKPILPAPN